MISLDVVRLKSSVQLISKNINDRSFQYAFAITQHHKEIKSNLMCSEKKYGSRESGQKGIFLNRRLPGILERCFKGTEKNVSSSYI